MKLMSNLISTVILASSLAAFNVPMAIASDLQPQTVIKETFADFTLNLHQSSLENNQVILRQEITKAAKAFSENKVTTQDLINYAVSDMNPAEAASFKKMAAALSNADLDSSEGQELLEKVLMSQSKGSHFLPCGSGFFTAIFIGPIAVILAIVAIEKFSDVTRKDRQQIVKEKAFIESEIDILLGEGVSSDSYLVTSRKAELVQLDIEYSQMLDDKEKDEKTGMIVSGVAGAMALTIAVSLIKDQKCGY
jgi:hypothetical protein